MNNHEFLIITGVSGAGKTTALNFFEDRGYVSIDNLPVELLLNLYYGLSRSRGKVKKIACVIDTRSWENIDEFLKNIRKLRKKEANYGILYLDSKNEIILNRYNLTRRKHPINTFGNLLDNIIEEKKLLQPIKDMATDIIDTTDLSTKEIGKILESYLDIENKQLTVNISSFGFKYGVPIDFDLMFDVRFMKNPYYIPELRPKTGEDKEVNEYVMSFEESNEFYDKLHDMIKFLLPLYIIEGKSHLSIGIGCSGGKHRSVTVVNKLAEDIKRLDLVSIIKSHRDIRK